MKTGITFGGWISFTAPELRLGADADASGPAATMSPERVRTCVGAAAMGSLYVECAIDANGRRGREVGNDAVRDGTGRTADRGDDGSLDIDRELVDAMEDNEDDEAESGDGDCGAKRDGFEPVCNLSGDATDAACIQLARLNNEKPQRPWRRTHVWIGMRGRGCRAGGQAELTRFICTADSLLLGGPQLGTIGVGTTRRVVPLTTPAHRRRHTCAHLRYALREDPRVLCALLVVVVIFTSSTNVPGCLSSIRQPYCRQEPGASLLLNASDTPCDSYLRGSPRLRFASLNTSSLRSSLIQGTCVQIMHQRRATNYHDQPRQFDSRFAGNVVLCSYCVPVCPPADVWMIST